MKDTIAVVGSGPVGLTAALAAHKLGYKVFLIDKHHHRSSRHIAKPLVISLATSVVLKRLGIDMDQASPLKKVRLTVDSALQSLVCTSDEVSMSALGFLQNGGALLQELNEAVDACQLIQRVEGAIEDYDGNGVVRSLILKDGQRIDAALVIAADGKHSVIRQRLGIPWVDLSYQTLAYQLPITFKRPLFQAELRLLEMGSVALIPAVKNIDGHMVWVIRSCQVDSFLAKLKSDGEQVIKASWSEWLPEIHQIHWQQARSYECQRRYVTSLVKSGAVLLGDAAMTWEPLGAQMFNLAVSDIAALYDDLDHRGGESLLLDYQEKRLKVHHRLRSELSLLSDLAGHDFGQSLTLMAMDMPLVKSIWMKRAMGFHTRSSLIKDW